MSKMTGIEVLKGARKLLERRGAWGQGENARDKTGRVILPTSPDAVRFCLNGALMRAAGSNCTAKYDAHARLEKVLGLELDEESLTDWNDANSRRKHQVLAALDKAIGGSRCSI